MQPNVEEVMIVRRPTEAAPELQVQVGGHESGASREQTPADDADASADSSAPAESPAGDSAKENE
jgi:hypothetical protein